jgi:hypothetical protein
MKFNQAIKNVFVQLDASLQLLTDEQYSRQSRILFNATIGQHVRHVIELFICLGQGYETGTVNYEKRKRDYRIETDRQFACQLMKTIMNDLDRQNKELLLEASYDEHSNEDVTVSTNYYREIIYNLEHTVHHMALIRVGINEVSSVELPESFGIASSTIKYRKECAQ